MNGINPFRKSHSIPAAQAESQILSMSQPPASKPLAGRWLMLRIWLSAWAAGIEWDFRNGLIPFMGSSHSWVFLTSTRQKFKYQVNTACNLTWWWSVFILRSNKTDKFQYIKLLNSSAMRNISPTPNGNKTKRRRKRGDTTIKQDMGRTFANRRQ